MKYQIVNEQGLNEIKEFLAAHHKLGGDHFDREMIIAWAAVVERHLADGNGAFFEIRASDTVSGHAEIHYLSDDSIEWMGEDDDDADEE